MAKRQKEWAKRARAALMELLGNRCAICGADYESRELEFDCISPRGDRHHKLDTERRVCFYRKEYKQGNLQLLCVPCHSKKSCGEIYWQESLAVESECPF